MSSVFATIKLGYQPMDPTGKPVGAPATKTVNKVFPGDSTLEDIREWAKGQGAASCSLNFETD